MKTIMSRAFGFALAASLPVSGLSAQSPAPAPQGAAAKVLGAAERSEVVVNIAIAAESRYADPEAGERLAAHLRQRLRAGAFEAFSDPVEFAAALTQEMRSVVQDAHLRTVYEPNRAASAIAPARPGQAAGPQGAGPRSFARIDPRSDEQIARTNFGFDRADRLPGNVGYLKLAQFVPLALSGKTAAAAMDFLGNSDAVIIDVRGNRGGSPDLVQFLISYFTGPQPVQLMESYNRVTGASNKLMSLVEVPGRRLTGKPLYILIDGYSLSAAEMLPYFAKRHKLATLVGETTGGAGIGGNNVPVGSNITFFLPFMRILDGPGWERVGVTPDVAAPPEQALEFAHKAALERLAAEAADPQVKREREWALELLRSFAPAAGAAELDAFTGTFGTRAFTAEGGKLFVTLAGGRPQPLARIADNVFRTATGRYTFERDAAGAVTAVSAETADGTETRAPKS